MKFLKYHISIILPLFLLLFAIESFGMLKKIIDNYALKINNDYSIVIVSKVPLDKNILSKKVKNISSLKIIVADKMIDRLRNNISQNNLQKLKNSLPLFYSLKLKNLPTKQEIVNIQKKIEGITGVKSVSTFEKKYDKFYNFLLFNRMILLFFTLFVTMVVLLLIIKQAEVWIFEHKQRFEIMTILGAPFWMKTAMLYRVVIVDAIISSLIVSSLFFYILNSKKSLEYFTNLGVSVPKMNICSSSLSLLGIGIFVSIVSVTFAIIKLNQE